jgi:hypothetical protein
MNRAGGPFHEQLAAGEAQSIEEAMAAARTAISQPRERWAKLPRSWVNTR